MGDFWGRGVFQACLLLELGLATVHRTPQGQGLQRFLRTGRLEKVPGSQNKAKEHAGESERFRGGWDRARRQPRGGLPFVIFDKWFTPSGPSVLWEDMKSHLPLYVERY